jgi:hypothetical protein
MMIRLNLGVNTGKIDNNVRFSILCYKQYSEACLNRTSLWPTIVFEIDKCIVYSANYCVWNRQVYRL